MPFTEHKDDHKQICPRCLWKLETKEDYSGGGSHYWKLICPKCYMLYTYDTYRFLLEELVL